VEEAFGDLERRGDFRALAWGNHHVFTLGPDGVVDEQLERELLLRRPGPTPRLRVNAGQRRALIPGKTRTLSTDEQSIAETYINLGFNGRHRGFDSGRLGSRWRWLRRFNDGSGSFRSHRLQCGLDFDWFGSLDFWLGLGFDGLRCDRRWLQRHVNDRSGLFRTFLDAVLGHFFSFHFRFQFITAQAGQPATHIARGLRSKQIARSQSNARSVPLGMIRGSGLQTWKPGRPVTGGLRVKPALSIPFRVLTAV
jgi:hypothetical protein